jgi:anti-sigma factor RsiW
MSCERVIEVEDWTLGLLEASEAESVATHIASCVDCQDAKAMFEEERALFEGRAVAVATPLPPLALPRPSLLARINAGRAMPALAALAACIAAVIGGAHAFAPDDCASPITTPATFIAPAADEQLLCRAPSVSEGRLFSENTPAPLSSHEPPTLACEDRATCDLLDDAL